MRSIRVIAAAALAGLAIAAAGCGGDDTAATTRSHDQETTTTSVASPYPREVPIASIKDRRIRDWLATVAPDAATAVQLAPGIFAERGHGSLGAIEDYPAILGLCADTSRYETQHPGTASTCW